MPPKAWADFVNHPAQRPTIFDLNVVQTTPAYQLAGLQAMAASGVPVQMIELGNELWDVYQGGFRTGAAYRASMEPYIKTIALKYPAAKFALVGHEFHGGRSAVAWNQEVFDGTNTTGHAHAATIHIYTIINSRGIDASNVAYRGLTLTLTLTLIEFGVPRPRAPHVSLGVPDSAAQLHRGHHPFAVSALDHRDGASRSLWLGHPRDRRHMARRPLHRLRGLPDAPDRQG